MHRSAVFGSLKAGNMTPPSVILHGALDIDNFGDVLLAQIFSTWLREEDFEVLLADASPLVRDQLGPTAALGGREPSALVYIGGGYFGEPPRSMIGKWKWGFRMIERHIRP